MKQPCSYCRKRRHLVASLGEGPTLWRICKPCWKNYSLTVKDSHSKLVANRKRLTPNPIKQFPTA